jgi:putative ABC transport system permease protein
MDTVRQDIRYALRRLVRSPGFTIVSVLTLALGIGANSAIFSVVYGVLLKPLPFAQPDRLVGIYHLAEGHRATMSGPNFTDVRTQAETLVDAAAVTRSRVTLTGHGEPVRLDGAEVSTSFFNVLGVSPALGRTFRSDEGLPGHAKVAVLGYGLWQQRFGGAPGVIGQMMTLDGVSTEIIGVMPEQFAYPAGRVIWTPIEETESFTKTQRGAWYLNVIGRAKPGVPLEQVTAEVQTVGKRLARQYPNDNEGLDFTAMSLHEAIVGDIRPAVLVLLGAVGFVLLIACTNVANLLLARAATRESEMAVRSALGAGRVRLVRQLLTESVILGFLGGAFGLLFAIWGLDGLLSLKPEGIPRLTDVRIDPTVILFTMALSTSTGLLFGVIPAFHATTSSLAATLKEAGRGPLTTRGGSRMRSALVVGEMALAVMLLAGAGLLIRSFVKLASVDPGFHAAQALTFELSLPDARYEKTDQQVAFVDQLLPRLQSIPGVEKAAAVQGLPLTGGNFVISFQVKGRPPVAPSQQPSMQIRVATPGYFDTIGIPLKRGRFFTDDDREGSSRVVLITERAARQYFPGEDPIGKTITLGWGRGEGTPRAGGEVVGIVGDVKEAGLDESEPPQLYLPYRQWPVQGISVVLRTAVPPGSVTAAARRAVYATDPNMPVANVRTLQEIVARSISQPRFYTLLLTLFAAVALLLAAIGIFGVLSYAVAQRTREIGIRMALGAPGRVVRGLVVRQAMLFALIGVALGTILAFWLSTSLVSKMLFNTSPHDASTYVAVAGVLTMVALLASYIPARRATRVDPIVALRSE